MNPLDEAWNWYLEARRVLRLTQRLGKKHWDDLPTDCGVFRDDDFKEIKGVDLAESARITLMPIDDFAIIKLFSAFECSVRERVRSDVESERKKITHPALEFAAEEALSNIRRGSFAKV